jgi:hypothetical protein
LFDLLLKPWGTGERTLQHMLNMISGTLEKDMSRLLHTGLAKETEQDGEA